MSSKMSRRRLLIVGRGETRGIGSPEPNVDPLAVRQRPFAADRIIGFRDAATGGPSCG